MLADPDEARRERGEVGRRRWGVTGGDRRRESDDMEQPYLREME